MEEIKYTGEIKNLIALCYIIDDYENFEKQLKKMISPKYNRDFVFQLWDISKGKFKFGAKKATKFYNENKEVIDTINKYTNVPTFINLNYGFRGEPNIDFQIFYKYILNHRDELKQILALLEKLEELGFDKIKFNEELDFTKDIYNAYSSFGRNFDITYVANAEVIPNYESHINYKTSNSNYKMKLGISGISKKEISKYDRKIELNSLLFNLDTLPIKIDKENTYGCLLKLKEKQKEKTSVIRNSVDLSISVSDLEQQFNYTNKTISSLEDIDNKEELIATLLCIKEHLEKLKSLSEEFDNNISQTEPTITSEVLKKEKSLYLRRREDSKIDWC